MIPNLFIKCRGLPSVSRVMRRRPTRQQGLTLVELMIAMTLGLLILLAVASIYIGSRQTYRMQEENARLQETGRYALEALGRSIRQAGFWNMPINPVATATAFVGTPITGTDGAAGAPDTVTVQYDGLIGDRDCEGTVLGANAVIAEAYSLNASNLVCDGNDALAAASPLVADIEDVQILYGIDTTPTDNFQSVGQYKATPTAAEWPFVVSARVCVQARSANSVNNAPQTFLNCAGAMGTAASAAAAFTTAGANDLRLRRTFVATYNLRNRVTNVP
jgi:type IV pilus assembly protein PilW